LLYYRNMNASTKKKLGRIHQVTKQANGYET
jgi:hypothetical protein